MPDKVLIVLDMQDNIIEQIPCNGTNSSEQRQLVKEAQKRYADMGQKVVCRVGYVNVPQELYESTKKILQESFEKHPEMGEMFEKDRPEFRHLGYHINKKVLKDKNWNKPKEWGS